MEKQLRSWTPRRPSPKIAARLFDTTRRAPAARAHLWNWLTPVAACALTVMVVVRGPMRRTADFVPATNAPAFAAVMFDPQASNAQRMFLLSHSDLNMEDNVWAHLGPWNSAMRLPRAHPATNTPVISAEL